MTRRTTALTSSLSRSFAICLRKVDEPEYPCILSPSTITPSTYKTATTSADEFADSLTSWLSAYSERLICVKLPVSESFELTLISFLTTSWVVATSSINPALRASSGESEIFLPTTQIVEIPQFLEHC